MICVLLIFVLPNIKIRQSLCRVNSAVSSLLMMSGWWDPGWHPRFDHLQRWSCTVFRAMYYNLQFPGMWGQPVCAGPKQVLVRKRRLWLTYPYNKEGQFDFGGHAHLETCRWLRFCFSHQDSVNLFICHHWFWRSWHSPWSLSLLLGCSQLNECLL